MLRQIFQVGQFSQIREHQLKIIDSNSATDCVIGFD
jgi:hypothetical protein